jgi:hypothetical protein
LIDTVNKHISSALVAINSWQSIVDRW